MRRKQSNKKIVVMAIALLSLISIGYAAISTTLKNNGNANIEAISWNVYFDNIQVKEGSISGEKVTTAPTTSGTSTTALNWKVSMDTPGEFYEFNVDVVNGGTIDAMVETATNGIVSSLLTAEQQKYLDYTIKYVNGAPIEQYDKLAVGETKTITVKLLFKQDINPEDLPTTAQDGISLSYPTNYVQANSNAVEKLTKIPLAIGTPVNYSTVLNGQTLNNWKVFYVDGDYTYIILDDYLPNAAVNISGIEKNGDYNLCVQSDSNRKVLIDAMTMKTNWTSLLKGTINGKEIDYRTTTDTNIYAMGSPDLDLWVNSWNVSYPSDKLYTKRTESAMSDGLKGYYVGDSPNPGTFTFDLGAKPGYDNTLYFPHKADYQGNYGYWLAAPSAHNDEYIVHIYLHYVNDWYFHDNSKAFRPVVCLPSVVVHQ